MGHVLEAAHLRIGKVCLKKAGGLVQVPCLLFFSAAPSALCGTYTSMYGVLFTYLGGLTCLTELSQRPSVLLTILPLLPLSTHSPYAVRWPLFLFFIDIILAVALSSWLAVYHHLWNDPATRGSRLMLTDILLASPTRESIALIIVFSPLLLNSGTLYLNLSFLTLTTCRRLRGRSIITFGGGGLKRSFLCYEIF